MCRKYEVLGESMTLAAIIARVEGKPHIPPRVTYSKQEKTSASKVLERLAQKADKSGTSVVAERIDA